MLSKTLAIFIGDQDSETLKNVNTIYDFLKKEYDDFVIITNENNGINYEHAIIPSIYLKFFRGDVVFMSISTYLCNQEILANNIYVCASLEDFLSNNVPKNRLGNAKILTIENSKIKVFNYAKL